MYGTIFYNVLIDNEDGVFNSIGLAVAKTMTMTIGEVDYTDVFLDIGYPPTFVIVCKYIILFIFVWTMPIAMTNLLIGGAVGEIEELSKNAEMTEFQSRVRLILEYACMLPNIVKYKQEKTLRCIFVPEPSEGCHIFKGILFLVGCCPLFCYKYCSGEADCDSMFRRRFTDNWDEDKCDNWKAEYLRWLDNEYNKHWDGSNKNQMMEDKIDILDKKITNREDEITESMIILQDNLTGVNESVDDRISRVDARISNIENSLSILMKHLNCPTNSMQNK